MISSPFKALELFRNGKFHNGVDIPLEIGTPLKAVSDGIIKLADYGNVNAGKTVFLETDKGTFIYAHLSEFLVGEGQKVTAGQTIALSGNTGSVIGNGHLHLGLKLNGAYVDPTQYADVVTSTSWFDKFLANGSIDSYEPIIQSLPDFLMGLSIEYLIIFGALLLLFFNKYTRPFTIGTLIILIII